VTEAQWWACADLERMLDWLRRDWKHSLFEVGRLLRLVRRNDKERRLRLFACACLRCAWNKLTDPKDRRSVEVAERYVDGLATERELALAGERYGIPAVAEATERLAWDAAQRAAHEAAHLLASNNLDDPQRRAVLTFLCGPLRDIFGPLPFRSLRVNPRWQTPVVLSLAQAAYEERVCSDPGHPGWLTLDPTRLLVLADALEEAGADEPELLDHLRRPGEHVRGCWVVDRLAGKE
jgi:hypothetical protein